MLRKKDGIFTIIIVKQSIMTSCFNNALLRRLTLRNDEEEVFKDTKYGAFKDQLSTKTEKQRKSLRF